MSIMKDGRWLRTAVGIYGLITAVIINGKLDQPDV